MYTKFNISLPVEVAQEIEKQRGDVSRSRFILRAVERVLKPGVKKKD